MANQEVRGRIVDAVNQNEGVAGLKVSAVDFDPIGGHDVLGSATTQANGEFTITYNPSIYRVWIADRFPDIIVRVYGLSHRLLYESAIHHEVTRDSLDVGDIAIHENHIEGLLVTNATVNPAGTHTWVTEGNQVDMLIDGHELFPKLTQSLQSATNIINFKNLFFSKMIAKFEDGLDIKSPSNSDADKQNRVRLLDVLKDKADGEDNVSVSLLLSDLPLDFLELDTVDKTKDMFQDSHVHVRGADFGLVSYLHAKAVTVDGETGYVIGSPMKQNYFSDPDHLIHDARNDGSLIHDVSIKVQGPAVEYIDRTFTTLWNEGNEPVLGLAPSTGQAPVAQPGVKLQVVRTLPGDQFDEPGALPSHITDPSQNPDGIPFGETGVLEAYQRAIASATDYIYLENQYFTAPAIGRAIVERMKQVPSLEVIIVLNMNPDVPGYPILQTRMIRKMYKDLGVHKDRLGIFTIWSHDATTTPKQEIMPIYVHSKVAIIDDKWATVGSANTDGASMNHFQFDSVANMIEDKLSVVAQPLIILLRLIHNTIEVLRPPTQHANPFHPAQPPRHAELNVVIHPSNESDTTTEAAVKLREDLWREHLGQATENRPSLSVWKSLAKAKLDNLKDPDATESHPAKILEWQPQTKPRPYLEALGIKDIDNKFRVRRKAPKFNFDTGEWTDPVA